MQQIWENGEEEEEIKTGNKKAETGHVNRARNIYILLNGEGQHDYYDCIYIPPILQGVQTILCGISLQQFYEKGWPKISQSPTWSTEK